MLTPRFELTQNAEEVVIRIYAKYANIRDTEVYVEGSDFRFYSAPYYLRLKLPGEIIENDESKGAYDCDSGTFTLKFSKANRGEHFENLDMITTLLAPARERKVGAPTIEVIGNPAAQHENGVDPLANNPNGDDDWYIPQTPAPSTDASIPLNAPKYGFANKVSGALTSFEAGWLKDVVDLPSPDTTPQSQRATLREADELEHFNEEHYMADLVQVDETAKPSILFQPAWYELTTDAVELTDREKDILKELPNKEFLLDNDEKQAVLLGMVDILFSSCYNHRMTLGENSAESSWDVNKISGTLSWFQGYSSLFDVVRTAVRRSLCYPLYRHWDLSMKALEDVKQIVKLGRKMILKRFCEVHDMFNNSFEPRYLLNQLYIRDYLIWLQQASDSLIASVYNALDSLVIKKEDMGLDLAEIEAAAWSVLEDEAQEMVQIEVESSPEEQNLIIGNAIHDVVNQLDKVVLDGETSSEDSEDIEDSDTETDSESDTTSSSDMSSSSGMSSSSTSTTSSDTTEDSEVKKSPLILKVKNNDKQLDSDDSEE